MRESSEKDVNKKKKGENGKLEENTKMKNKK